jgi:heterodisulfide reductase subunit C
MSLFEELKKDIRFAEGLNGCISCGTCTAICPAAEVTDYDPRVIVETIQRGNDAEIEELLKGDIIWRCGECLSCKTRCPRGNTPCYIVQALRAMSVEKGYFIESGQGRRQLALKRTVGDHILQYGYCVYIDEVSNEMYPEQGPVWEWLRKNRESVLARLGANYNKYGSGALRKTAKESLEDLQKIFDVTGGQARLDKIEKYSREVAEKEGINFSGGRDDYFMKVYEK